MKKRRMIIAIACVLLAAAIGITAYAAVSAKNRTREMQKYDPSCNVHSNTQVVHHRVRKMQKYDPNCKAATDYYGYIKENEKSLSRRSLFRRSIRRKICSLMQIIFSWQEISAFMTVSTSAA